jgi:hypothetical protein
VAGAILGVFEFRNARTPDTTERILAQDGAVLVIARITHTLGFRAALVDRSAEVPRLTLLVDTTTTIGRLFDDRRLTLTHLCTSLDHAAQGFIAIQMAIAEVLAFLAHLCIASKQQLARIVDRNLVTRQKLVLPVRLADRFQAFLSRSRTIRPGGLLVRRAQALALRHAFVHSRIARSGHRIGALSFRPCLAKIGIRWVLRALVTVVGRTRKYTQASHQNQSSCPQTLRLHRANLQKKEYRNRASKRVGRDMLVCSYPTPPAPRHRPHSASPQTPTAKARSVKQLPEKT